MNELQVVRYGSICTVFILPEPILFHGTRSFIHVLIPNLAGLTEAVICRKPVENPGQGEEVPDVSYDELLELLKDIPVMLLMEDYL